MTDIDEQIAKQVALRLHVWSVLFILMNEYSDIRDGRIMAERASGEG